jgi:hypothetical protein
MRAETPARSAAHVDDKTGALALTPVRTTDPIGANALAFRHLGDTVETHMAAHPIEPAESEQDKTADKLTLRLSADNRKVLEWIASRYGNITLAEAVRRALGTEKFLLEQKEKGASILIQESDGRVKEIVFR